MEKKVLNKKVNLKVFARRSLLILLALYICVSLVVQQFNLSRLTKEERAIDNQIVAAEKHAKELEDEKALTGTDEYIERVARERLGFMKKYEKVFIDTNK